MSEVTTVLPPGQSDDPQPRRTKVVVHRLDGGLEDGESDALTVAGEGFPVYSTHEPTRQRIVPTRDIKYVVFGAVDDPNLEDDPGDATSARKAILRFKDGEWIAAYIEPSPEPFADGVPIKIRLPEVHKVIPAVAVAASLLDTQFVDTWTVSTAPPRFVPPREAMTSGSRKQAFIVLMSVHARI